MRYIPNYPRNNHNTSDNPSYHHTSIHSPSNTHDYLDWSSKRPYNSNEPSNHHCICSNHYISRNIIITNTLMSLVIIIIALMKQWKSWLPNYSSLLIIIILIFTTEKVRGKWREREIERESHWKRERERRKPRDRKIKEIERR